MRVYDGYAFLIIITVITIFGKYCLFLYNLHSCSQILCIEWKGNREWL